MPVHVELEDIKGSEGERARKLYAVKQPAEQPRRAGPRRVDGKSFQERSAAARGRMADRKRSTRTATKNATQARTARTRTLRGAGRRSLRLGRTVHRAAGSPGGAIAGVVTLFIGAGILVAVVRNPKVITTPLQFIGAAVRAFTTLFGTQGGTAAAPPVQNVAKAA